MARKGKGKGEAKESESSAFQELAKKVLSVPKAELDKREKAWKDAKAK